MSITDSIQLNFREAGAGEPLILLHAFPLNSRMWDGQISGLATQLRVIAPDLRGFGQSAMPGGQHSIEDMAEDVSALMSKLSISRATIVGLSMGGYIAMAFYRLYPEQVRALVLADTRSGADSDEARERRYKSAEKAERDGVAAIADDMVKLLLGVSTQQNKPEVIARVREIIESNSSGAIASAQRAMAMRLDSTELMKSVDVPTLIIVGAEDGLTPPSEAETLSRTIPSSRLHIIEGAGHLSNLEQPQQFNSAVISFMNSLNS